jgi:NAD(P)-dependent dehydrogenase (short-subunit alcohol dehydrogenase family)
LAIAARFASEGFSVYALCRRPDRLSARVAPLRTNGLAIELMRCDVTDPESIDIALHAIRQRHGHCDVLIYNAVASSAKSALELNADALIDDLRVNVAGALTLVRKTIVGMQAAGGGTILFTGCSESSAVASNAPSGAIGKAGLHTLAHHLERELKAVGIRVGIVSVGPAILTRANYVRQAAQRYWDMFVTSEQNYEPDSQVREC